jgi:phytoene dehydrogenase-like protein
MSDFMMSQVQGLLAKVTDDLDKMSRTSNAQTDMLLGAINDLAANLFATQAILCVMLRDKPVDAAAVKAWIAGQTGNAMEAPKAQAVVDQLLAAAKK